MALDILQGIIGAILSSLVWFVIGAAVYMNPVVTKVYAKYENDPSVKNRKDVKKIHNQYVSL